MPLPARPKIYHITHVDNLPKIVDGVLWSDAERLRQHLDCTVVGMTEIKRRRLEELEVDCHRGSKVGEYVPFYFCPRSVMLFLLHKGNSPGLTYQGGQAPVVHLQADLRRTIDWADGAGRRWAFSKGNAGAYYAQFFNEVAQLEELDWEAINATDWRDPDTKEGKQAEFLLERCFPWEMIERIGVINRDVEQKVRDAIGAACHRPDVLVARDWYY